MSESEVINAAPRRAGIMRRISNWLVRVFMPDDADALARQAWLERRLQSALITLLTGGIAWVVGTLWSVSGTVSQMGQRFEDLAIRVDGTYRSDVARRDRDEILRRLDLSDAADRRHEASINAVERRVDRVEYVIEREHRIELHPPAAGSKP